MRLKSTFCIAAVALLFSFSPNAAAVDEQLSVRFAGGGQVQAVVAGWIDNLCGAVIFPPQEITRTGMHILVESPDIIPLPCDIPIVPPEPYEVTADPGVLEPGNYTMTWRQGQQWEDTIAFGVAPIRAAQVPATGWLAGFALALSLLALALRGFRRGG